MRAIVCERFGPPEVLQAKELPKPSPAPGEVLVRVRATTVTSGDWRCRSRVVPRGFGLVAGIALGFRRPRRPILGMELAGEIEAVGEGVGRFAVGEAIFAFDDARMGAYAEYKCLPEGGPLALKPANLGFGEAAALSFGGTTALAFFRKAGIAAGDRVLVVGASGGVGTAAVQLARHFGAVVTGVCSAGNAELVRSLGAARVIDYAREDFTRDGERYDLIVDTTGTAPYARCSRSLAGGGRLLLVLGTLPDLLAAPWVALRGSHRVIAGSPGWTVEDLRLLARLAEAGRYRPVIDRTYPLDRIVEAHRYVDAGHKRGNVVIEV